MNPTAYDVARQTLLVLLPEFLILVTATAMMTAGAFVTLPRRVWSLTAAGAMVLALLALVFLRDVQPDVYSAVVINDPMSFYARLAFLLTGLAILGMAHDQVDDARAAEFFGSLLMIHAGSMLVSAANEMVLLFAGLELVSIPTYLILYLPRRNVLTQEAVTKYFYLSIFSSALLLFGLAYLYGLTGISNLKALGYLVHANLPYVPQTQFGLIAVVFVMAGLGFRVAAVPLHFYAPDVYQGSPTVLAALLAWVPKGIGFVAMLRVLTATLGGTSPVADKAVLLAWLIAVFSMTLGNTVALLQEDLKRLLAYSSIAHAGYLMIGVAAAFRNMPVGPEAILGGEGVLFYLATYALMTLGAFGVILALSTPERPVETVEDLSGLGRTHPWAALAMGLCLFSLAGVPPLAGFWGKFVIFSSALTAGHAHANDAPLFLLLTVLGVINAAIGAYYYLRIIMKMYLWPPSPATPRLEPRAGWPTVLAVGACAGLSLLFGLFPAPIGLASHQAATVAIAQPDPSPEMQPVTTAKAETPAP
ncbi:MAG: NADH-quinone oxidoreductase subunit N [Isosphaeraceae bacterium]|nr:NADH-quinone oxidoreductase subunit N [Isosphaeraceae bacterium]